jgi:deoxyribonuclease-4
MKQNNLGAHINKIDNSVIKTMEYVRKNNGNCLQLFVSNPRSCTLPNIESYKACAKEVLEYCKNNDFKLCIHSSYTINLAKPPLNNKRTVELKDCYWNALLLSQLTVSDIIGSIGVVVHVGKYTSGTDKEGLEHMKNSIKYIIGEMKKNKIQSKLIIETPAGAGTELLVNINHFMNFYNNEFTVDEKKHLGICLDTAHIWSSGYDINTYYDIISKKNMEDILVIHFNNSKKHQGSKVDSHEYIESGKIPLFELKDFILKVKKDKYNPLIILEKPSTHLEKELMLIAEWFL